MSFSMDVWPLARCEKLRTIIPSCINCSSFRHADVRDVPCVDICIRHKNQSPTLCSDWHLKTSVAHFAAIAQQAYEELYAEKKHEQ